MASATESLQENVGRERTEQGAAIMADSETCERCGSARSPNSPKGLCPRCLLAQAMAESESLASGLPRPGYDVTVALAPASSSVLSMIAESIGEVPSVLLRDSELESAPGPVVKPSSPDMTVMDVRPGRYQLFGE